MALPAELLDHILSFLRSDPETLKLCSESHSLLSQLAEPYLYYHVLLKTDESEQLFNLIELLSKRPYVAHYIRSLEIHVGGSHDKETQQRRLQGISTILPYLLALKAVTLNHTPLPFFGWEAQPESFRQAFLDCLRLQTMQDVCIKQVYGFPFGSALNGRCKSIRSLTVSGGLWGRSSNPPQINNLDMDGLLTNQGLPLKSLCIKSCEGPFLYGFAAWFATCGSQLQSLEFSSSQRFASDSLPMLLTSSSNSLTRLDIDLGLFNARYYDFKIYPIHSGNDDIPITLSALSHIEQLTIHSAFHYVVVSDLEKWGLYSPIPAITQLFSTNTPSLKHLFLNFDFTVGSFHPVQTKSLPWSLLSEIICTPLAHLLSTIYAFECPGSSSALSIQGVLRPGGAYSSHLSTAPGPRPRAIPQYVIHSLLSDSKELMQFVEKGIITPSVPASFNKNDFHYF